MPRLLERAPGACYTLRHLPYDFICGDGLATIRSFPTHRTSTGDLRVVRFKLRMKEGEVRMETSALLEPRVDIDPIEEMRLRAWARRNYAPAAERQTSWHPVILDEMRRKDREHAN